MQDVEVIESAGAAAAALDPIRARLLGELTVPAGHTWIELVPAKDGQVSFK